MGPVNRNVQNSEPQVAVTRRQKIFGLGIWFDRKSRSQVVRRYIWFGRVAGHTEPQNDYAEEEQHALQYILKATSVTGLLVTT